MHSTLYDWHGGAVLSSAATHLGFPLFSHVGFLWVIWFLTTAQIRIASTAYPKLSLSVNRNSCLLLC